MKIILFAFVFIASLTMAICQQQDIFINELMAKNDSFIEDDKGNFSDWIELYNSSSSEIDIGGYYLTDDMDTLHLWRIPEGTRIASNDYLIVWASGDDNGLHTNFKLGADGETIALVMPNGQTIIDEVEFGIQDADVSYGRVKDSDPNWIYFEEPTFGKANKKGSSNKLPVIINELMASNSKTIMDETGAYPDWAELYNNSDLDIDISGFYFTDEPYGYPSQWRIPAGTVIPARGFLIIWCDSDPEDGPYHTNFKLSKSRDSAAIFSRDGQTIIDLISWGEQSTDISYGRKRDADDDWVFFNIPTPGGTNNPVDVKDKIINSSYLYQNYPNPFQSNTKISFSLNTNGMVSLKVRDIFGSEIENLYNGYLEYGNYSFTFNRENISAGLYFCHLQFEGFTKVIKMIIE
jgi:hypothetical protein